MCASLVMNKATSIAMRVFNKQNPDITMQVRDGLIICVLKERNVIVIF